MPTIFERTVEKQIVFTLSEKADLGQIVLRTFLHAGYSIIQTAKYTSDEPEGFFQVINYPDSFTLKIDQCIDDFYEKKINPPIVPEKVTKKVTVRERKRIPLKRGAVKAWSSKPENPNQLNEPI